MTKFGLPVVLWGTALAGLVLTLIASVADWPAQFGADGSSPDGTIDWILSGSAMSAPVGLLVALVVIGFLATRDGILGQVADWLAFVVAAFLVVGSLGETFAPDPVTTPRGILVVSGIVGLAFASLVVWSAVNDLRKRKSPNPDA